MVLTAYIVLSPATNSSCHRHRRIESFVSPGRDDQNSADLTPATGARTTRLGRTQQNPSSPKGFVRAWRRSSTRTSDRSRKTRPAISLARRRCRVHRIPCPTFVTIMIRPFVRWDGGNREVIWARGKAGYFRRRGWTGQIRLNCFSKLQCWCAMFWRTCAAR